MAEPILQIDTKEGRLCCHCKHRKPLIDFSVDRSMPKGRHRECKECQNKRHKIWYKEHKEEICKRTREHHAKVRNSPHVRLEEWSRLLKLKYDIDARVYHRMLREQKRVCAMCGKPERIIIGGRVKRLAVDHNHCTNEIRSLLCDTCNRLIGIVNDDIQRLELAIEYLRRHNHAR